jgi:hypothetical protein
MSDLVIFIFGSVVTAITATATVLIGFSEASDTSHARQEDLTRLEKKIVGQERAKEGHTT